MIFSSAAGSVTSPVIVYLYVASLSRLMTVISAEYFPISPDFIETVRTPVDFGDAKNFCGAVKQSDPVKVTLKCQTSSDGFTNGTSCVTVLPDDVIISRDRLFVADIPIALKA